MTGAPLYVWSTRCSDMAPPPRLTAIPIDDDASCPTQDAPAGARPTMGRSSTFGGAQALLACSCAAELNRRYQGERDTKDEIRVVPRNRVQGKYEEDDADDE